MIFKDQVYFPCKRYLEVRTGAKLPLIGFFHHLARVWLSGRVSPFEEMPLWMALDKLAMIGIQGRRCLIKLQVSDNPSLTADREELLVDSLVAQAVPVCDGITEIGHLYLYAHHPTPASFPVARCYYNPTGRLPLNNALAVLMFGYWPPNKDYMPTLKDVALRNSKIAQQMLEPTR